MDKIKIDYNELNLSRIFLLFMTIITLLGTVALSSSASDRPEIFANIGHVETEPIVSIALGPINYVASISKYEFGNNWRIVLKIWDRKTSRLYRNKVLEFKEDELYSLSILFSFFSNDERNLLILIDNRDKDNKKDILISYNFIDDKVDVQSFIFNDFFRDVISIEDEPFRSLKDLNFAKYRVFHRNEWKRLFSKFNHKPYLPYVLESSNYNNFSKVSIKFSKAGNLIEKAEIKIKNNELNVSPANLKVRSFPRPVLSIDEEFILAKNEDGTTLILYDINNNKLIKFGNQPVYQEWIVKGTFKDYAISYDYRNKNGFIVWNLKDARLEKIGIDVESIPNFIPDVVKNKDGDIIITEHDQTSKTGNLTLKVFKPNIVLFNKKTGKEIAQFILFTDGEWIVITPEGYYNASPNGDKYLNVRIGNNVYGIENYREAFYRPDLVKLAFAGKSLEGYRTLADAGTPPMVEIIDTPEKTDKEEIKVTVKITDSGAGIGDIRLYLNDTAVLVDSVRGVKITPKQGEKSIYKTYTVKLLNGENVIKAVAFNGDNTMQSNPAVHKVIASIGIKKPSMYVVAIGINEYKNPKLTLKYAVADAKLFSETIGQVAKPLFEKVEIKLLTTKEETTKEHIKKTLEAFKNLNPEDVFVFYVASHGTVDEGEYFLITSNVGSLSTFRLKEDALTQAELKELIANVPSTKKLIVIDTCNAGKLGEALQMAMLTRGMSEETAVKILSKAVGSMIISASTSLQEALEGYQGHGLFTYVLTEGLKGKADTDKDGFIKTLELATYADSEVPALAEKVFKRAQYPTATPTGQSFPVGKVR